MKLFIIFIAGYIYLALRGFGQPIYFTVLYLYLTFLYPQGIMYEATSFPFQLLAILFAFLFGFVARPKMPRFMPSMALYLAFFVWTNVTTAWAEVPTAAAFKWSWVIKAMPLPLLLPLLVRGRKEIESALIAILMGILPHVLVAGTKTLFGGGGYGSLRLLLPSNVFLGETSALSLVAVISVPLLYYVLFNSLASESIPFKRLILAGYLVVSAAAVVGTAARTGLVVTVCAALVAIRGFWKKFAMIASLGAILTLGLNLLPSFWLDRMSTLSNVDAESSAAGRLAVWRWTWEYASEHPLGGGFDAYRKNELKEGGTAFHSMYFEVLGEQGFPGLALFLLMWLGLAYQLWRMSAAPGVASDLWVANLARCLSLCTLCILVGGSFIGIAYTSFVTIWFGLYWCTAEQLRLRPATAMLGEESFEPSPLPSLPTTT